jgi:dTDP-3-amino-2,3,6-trideoxy-4-keto-D-glucose/dTDP-3-amino-3,4,6-trideoxy-alpha-D-glucose/dTDP-2,6-dideoxy-D-kanosamine transaminase
MKVPLNDLRRAVIAEAPVLTAAIHSVIHSGWYILGNEVRQFEEEFASYLGVLETVSVANGTDALELALRAVGVQPSDEVITVANAGMYASTAIRKIGALPRYVDVQESTMNLHPGALDAAFTPKTRAVIVTHLYGRMADVEAIARSCDKRGIPLVEDCAQAHGAQHAGRRAGSFGKLACFSFYPTKNLGALGDGGAVATSDRALGERLRGLRQYGWQGKYDVRLAGGSNSRLDEIQAAVLRARLRSLDEQNERRVEIARIYSTSVKHSGIEVPVVDEGSYVAHLYVLRSERRDALRAHLAEHGVSTDVHYPIADHLQAAYASGKPGALPVTEMLAAEVLTLPCFPELTDEEVRHVIHACNSWRDHAA